MKVMSLACFFWMSLLDLFLKEKEKEKKKAKTRSVSQTHDLKLQGPFLVLLS